MAKSRQQKVEALSSVKEKLAAAKTVVFVDYSGLTVEAATALRRQSKEQGAEYLVTKKTLLAKATAEQGVSGYDCAALTGNLGELFGFTDEVAPAKLAKDTTKTSKTFKILAGIMEGSFINNLQVEQLAALPSKDMLLAKLVGSLNSPLSGLVNVFAGNQRGLVRVLQSIADSKS